jgi:hypothetical protein
VFDSAASDGRIGVAVLTVTIERGANQVVCRGHRHLLRVERSAAGLRVAAADAVSLRWRRVDDDLVTLIRAATRLLAVDRQAADRVADEAAALAGAPRRDPHPVSALVRAVFPLLASAPPWPLPPLPTTLPTDLQPAFRCTGLASAARLLFDDRATRPVVRELGALLAEGTESDLFVISLALAAAPLLAPDQLAGALAVRGFGPRAPLTPTERDRLRGLMHGAAPQRLLAVLRAGARDAPSRRRVRFVAAAAPADGDLDWRRSWEDLALDVAVAGAGP